MNQTLKKIISKIMPVTLLSIAVWVPVDLSAITNVAGTDPYGNPCDVVTWTDSKGNARSVWLVTRVSGNTHGGFITRYTWMNGAIPVDARPRDSYPPWGFLVLANHWHPESGGQYVSSVNSGVSAGGPVQTIMAPGAVTAVPFSGPNHLVWQSSFKMRIDPNLPLLDNNVFFNTIQYLFTEGRDDFVWSVAYDAGNKPDAEMWSDNRSPYGDMDWDGDGSGLEAISGLGWGTLYKFASTSSPLSMASSYDYTQANTVPYIWQYKNAGAGDAELAIVQNQTYEQQNAGMEVHVGSCAGPFPAPPASASSMPSSIGCIAMQLNSYGGGNNYQGQRFTWGSNYRNVWGIFGNGKGVFQEGHEDAFVLKQYTNQYPVNAWSMNVLIDKFTDNGQAKLVTDTENVYASTLSASTGFIVTTGPRGPGNNMSAATGSMPTITYYNPGFDFVTRAWRANAAGGIAVLNHTVSGGLDRPTYIIGNMPTAPCAIKLDGVDQVDGVDIALSHDAVSQELYVTFRKTLATGLRNIEFTDSCGTPTFTATVCGACTATFTATMTRTPTITPTWTETPPCPNGMFDNMDDNNTGNDWGGSWSTWNGGGLSTTLPSPFVMTAPGFGGSGFAANLNGTNDPTGAATMSSFFNAGGTQVDISAFDGIRFNFKGDGKEYRMQIFLDDGSWNTFGTNFTPAAGVWTPMDVPFSSMTPGWGGPEVWDPTIAMYVTFYPTTAGTYDMWVDDVNFYCVVPTATPTPAGSFTFTNTPLPSATASATAPGTFTVTPTWTQTSTPGPCPDNPNTLLLAPNQKIVFMGDSITFRGNYTLQLESYLKNRYPTYNLSFVNTGVGGWTAANAVADNTYGLNHVLSLNPDIVTVCYGPNDAGLVPWDASKFSDYQDAINTIVTTLKGAGIQVVLLGPGIVDRSVPWASNPANVPADYNTTLKAYADWLVTYAASQSVPVFQLHDLTLATDNAAKAAYTGAPAYTDRPQDGLHINPSGGLAYVYGLLTALGVPYDCRSLQVNAGAGTINASAGLGAGPVASIPNGISFTLTTNPMPYVGNPQAAKMLPFIDFQQKFNYVDFSVSALPAAAYYIIVDGYRAGPVSAAQLSLGVNLFDYWTKPASSTAQSHTIDVVDAAVYVSAACYDGLIDDMENSNDFPPTPANAKWPSNLWGGLWYGGSGSGGASTSSPSSFVMSGPGYLSPNCARLFGTTDLGGNLQLLLTYLYTQYDNPKDGVTFWFKGDAGKDFRFQAHTEYQDLQVPINYADFGYTFTATGSWQQVTILYSDMTQPSWVSGPDVFTFDPGQITVAMWLPYFTGTFDMSVDDFSFYCDGGPPTPTITPTSPAVSATPTSSATGTATASPTTTSTYTPSATLSATDTPLPGSPTDTATPAPPTATATISATSTISPTATYSPTVSLTATVTPTATPTNTSTSTFTLTHSPTSEPTDPPTHTPTQTQVISSFTLTNSPTSEPTDPPTHTPTQTQVISSFTLTHSPTSEPTDPPTSTPTPVFTATATDTVTDTSAPVLASSSPQHNGFVNENLTGPGPDIVVSLQDNSSGLDLSSPIGMLSLVGPAGVLPASIAVSGSGNAAQLILTPLSPLLAGGSYLLKVNACDLAGNCMSSEIQFTVVGYVGGNNVLQAMASPNPNPYAISVELLGSVDKIQVRVYTPGMTLAGEFSYTGALRSGWNSVPFPPGFLATLANSTYYARVAGLRNGEAGEMKTIKLLVLK